MFQKRKKKIPVIIAQIKIDHNSKKQIYKQKYKETTSVLLSDVKNRYELIYFGLNPVLGRFKNL